MAAKRKPEPMRTRLTVPAADQSVIDWLELQDDPSGSMRRLVRDSIEREGFTDVLNRPVDQLPRRGRPPQNLIDGLEVAGESGQGRDEREAQPVVEVKATGTESIDSRVETAAVQEAPGKTAPVQNESEIEAASDDDDAETDAIESEPEVEPKVSSDGPVDMSDLFGHNKKGKV